MNVQCSNINDKMYICSNSQLLVDVHLKMTSREMQLLFTALLKTNCTAMKQYALHHFSLLQYK